MYIAKEARPSNDNLSLQRDLLILCLILFFSHSVFWDAPIDDLAVYVGSNFRKPTLDVVSTFSLMHFYQRSNPEESFHSHCEHSK